MIQPLKDRWHAYRGSKSSPLLLDRNEKPLHTPTHTQPDSQAVAMTVSCCPSFSTPAAAAVEVSLCVLTAVVWCRRPILPPLLLQLVCVACGQTHSEVLDALCLCVYVPHTHLDDEDAKGCQHGYLQLCCCQAQLRPGDAQQQCTQQRQGQEVCLEQPGDPMK